MPERNALIVNGKSTADLPFFCGVRENSPPARAEKKDQLYDLDMVNGNVVQTIDAWKPVTKQYLFYLHDVTKSQFRAFKAFIGWTGWFSPSDDPGMRYVYQKAVLESSPVDEFDGYEVAVTFTCEPFEYEEERTEELGSSIENHTNAPMYPRLIITGDTTSSTFLQIGEERMTFTNGIRNFVTIECKHGLQDVKDSNGLSINSQVRGPFFEIVPGEHAVTKGTGITSVQMTKRWGWL